MFIDLGRAQEILQRRKIDVAVSSRPENVIHVGGVTDNLEFRFNKEERTYALIFPSEEPVLVAQWFEVPHLRNRSHIKTIVPDQVWTSFPGNSKAVLQGDAEMTVAEIIRDHHLSSGRIGIDERAIPLAAFQKLRKNIPRATFVRATSIFEEIRAIKTDAEISHIEKAAEAVDKAYATLQANLQKGVTERELTSKVRDAILTTGSDVVFNFVSSGPRAGIDHVTGENIPVDEGEIVKCDIGARHEGYCSDVGRTFACGHASRDQKRIYQRILETEERVLSNAKPGVTGADLFSIYEEGMREGYGDVPWHMIGHGIGLEIHEVPDIGPSGHVALRPGMVVCVEIGYLEPGRQGYHLEDMILVTEEGCRILTSFPKNFLI